MIVAKVVRRKDRIILGAKCNVCTEWVAVELRLAGILYPIKSVVKDGSEMERQFDGPVLICADCVQNGVPDND